MTKITLKILLVSLFCSATSSCILSNHAGRLITDLNDEDSQVREESARALGKVHSVRSVEALIDALKDKESAVRWNAATSLGWIKDPQAVEPLIIALKDDHPWVRRSAAWSYLSGQCHPPPTLLPLPSFRAPLLVIWPAHLAAVK